jgi:DNA-binding NarL/FixJ family response regulator
MLTRQTRLHRKATAMTVVVALQALTAMLFLADFGADVALFAIKGCDAAEIAHLRGAALGTVHAKLTRVYAKAGVNSQSALVALFLDELIDPATMKDRANASA